MRNQWIGPFIIALVMGGIAGCSDGSSGQSDDDAGATVGDTSRDGMPTNGEGDGTASDGSTDGTSAATCQSDEDCPDGICHSETGKCRACEDGGDCIADTTPYCTESGTCAECLFDMHCASGSCQNDSQPYECTCVETGKSCESDGDCCSNNCGGGVCKSESCVAAGRSCESSVDCCGKNVCNNDSGECEECAGEGDTCENVECCGDLSCIGSGTSGGTSEKECKSL